MSQISQADPAALEKKLPSTPPEMTPLDAEVRRLALELAETQSVVTLEDQERIRLELLATGEYSTSGQKVVVEDILDRAHD